MTAEISEAIEEAVRRVRSVLPAGTKPGDTTIVAGIGNTLGTP